MLYSYLGMLSILCTALKDQIPTPLATPVVTLFCYFGVIRIKMFVLKHWIFFEDISNFNKWKSLIKGKKMLELRNALLWETLTLLPK